MVEAIVGNTSGDCWRKRYELWNNSNLMPCTIVGNNHSTSVADMLFGNILHYMVLFHYDTNV